MSETAIPHEGRFLKALGVNPDNVVVDSTKLEWKGGQAVLYFIAAHPLDPRMLGMALMEAAGPPEVPSPAQEVVPEQTEAHTEDVGNEDTPVHNEQEGEGGDPH